MIELSITPNPTGPRVSTYTPPFRLTDTTLYHFTDFRIADSRNLQYTNTKKDYHPTDRPKRAKRNRRPTHSYMSFYNFNSGFHFSLHCIDLASASCTPSCLLQFQFSSFSVSHHYISSPFSLLLSAPPFAKVCFVLPRFRRLYLSL